MAALVTQFAERPWANDPYGTQVFRWEWDWHDERIMAWINNFEKISKRDTLANVDRQNIKRTGQLRRSLAWKTWAASGGDTQVFSARYIYYAKYMELAVGWQNPYNGPVPQITRRNWSPITVPTRKMKGRPHVVTEMRKQARKFSTYARKHFMFVGTMFMVYAMGGQEEPSVRAAVNRALFWAARKERTPR